MLNLDVFFRLQLRRVVLLACVVPLFAGAAARSAASSVPPTDPLALKAVFLYRLVNFVQWHADLFARPGEPFVIGILGRNPFGALLDEVVRGETFAGHPIAIRAIDGSEGAPRCHLLYVAPGAERFFRPARRVLTVGETDAFLSRGGIIRFVTEGSKVRLKINLRAAKAAGVTLDSQILSASQVINHDP